MTEELNAGPTNTHAKRFRLPRSTEEFRRARLAVGRVLSRAEKLQLYDDICAKPGCERYSFKVHMEFCRRQEDTLTRARDRLAHDLEAFRRSGSVPDLLRIAAWERDLNIPAAVVFEIVWDIAAERVKEELERQTIVAAATA